VGLTSSFWVALAGVLLLSVSLGMTGPVHSAYLHQVVPSEQRATVVSFDSMLSNAGSIGGQVGLGALGEARSVGSAFVVGGVVTVAALPFLGRLRRLGGAPDEIVGQRAGVEGACAATGIPAVSSVDTSVHEVAELAGVASHG
jgi:MFS family permease